MCCFLREFSIYKRHKTTLDDLKELFVVLSKIIIQAKKTAFAEEMEYVCKYMFGMKIVKSDIWNS